MLQETNGPIVNILKAVLKAQSTIPEIEKKSEAKVKTKSGYEYSYKYADLADIQRSLKKPLLENDLFFVHNIIYQDKTEFLISRLMHVTGEYLQCVNVLPQVSDPQEKAALLTYFKRYAICGLLDLCTDEDIDGKVNTTKNQADNPATRSQVPSQGVSTSHLSEAQLRRLFAITKQYGWSKEQLKSYMLAVFNIDSTKKLTKFNYDLVCKIVETKSFDQAMSELNLDDGRALPPQIDDHESFERFQ